MSIPSRPEDSYVWIAVHCDDMLITVFVITIMIILHSQGRTESKYLAGGVVIFKPSILEDRVCLE